MLQQLSKAKYLMRFAPRWLFQFLLLVWLPLVYADPSPGITPLAENLRALHCATQESTARTALERLKLNLNPLTGLPDEWEGSRTSIASIHAGTVDIAVASVIQTTTNYPALTALAESLLFSWNYCRVFHNGSYYDLDVERSHVDSTPVDYDSPSNWDGFTQLGLGATSAARYQPQAFRATADTTREKLLYNWWNLQRNQCLPHPANGRIFHRQQYVARAKVNTDDTASALAYPLAWSANCAVPFTDAEIELEKKRQKQQIHDARIAHASREWINNTRILEQRRLDELARLIAEREAVRPVKLFNVVAPKPVETPPVFAIAHQNLPVEEPPTSEGSSVKSLEPEAERAPKTPRAIIVSTPQVTLTTTENAKNTSDLASRVEWYKNQLKYADKQRTAEIMAKLDALQPRANSGEPSLAAAKATTPAQTSYQSGSVPPFESSPEESLTTKEPRKYHGLSGSFALSNRRFEPDDWSFTANVSYKPIVDNYYFARTGFTWVDSEEPVSYYWGIGYNDWHPGTWAFELNNWGPLNPGDGLKVEKAIASISYKFDSPLLKSYNISTSATLSGGKSSNAALTFASSWTPKPNWFFRNLITQPLEGGATTWAYGFGYNNWRAQTWSLEYNNWGPNTLSSPNFRDNALVTLSWKWNL